LSPARNSIVGDHGTLLQRVRIVGMSQKALSPDGAHVAYAVICKPQQGQRALFQIVVLDRTGKETAHARFLINEEIGEVCKPDEGCRMDR